MWAGKPVWGHVEALLKFEETSRETNMNDDEINIHIGMSFVTITIHQKPLLKIRWELPGVVTFVWGQGVGGGGGGGVIWP